MAKIERPAVVISGVSGRFPSADTMEEFERNLFNGTDMVTADDSRWPMGLWNLTPRNGKIRSVDRFDNEYFELNDKIVNYADPQERLFLELTFEALIDAGHDPADLRSSKTGFFWGSCFLETHGDFDDPMRIPSVERSMISRVSQFFDFKGPLIHTDTACNSSLNAFNEAVMSLRLGLCDKAVVAGSNTCFRPLVSLRFRDLKMISKDGICKCLDESANGYCRSEAVVVVFLEREKDAKRVYARVLHSKSNSDGYKDEGITFPSKAAQQRLAEEVYREADIDPADIGYIEAHVTGTAAGDPVEMQAMYDVICTKRKDPLIIGCVKSLIGHSEGASGLCSLAKALIVMQNRSIPPNIYYKAPNPNITGLMDGKMIAPTKIMPLPGEIVPVNSFGFGGANTHVVLQGVYDDKPVTSSTNSAELPRLVTVCGRTMESVRYVLKKLACDSRLITNEFLSLVDDFASIKNEKFKYRGYGIVRRSVVGTVKIERTEPRLVEFDRVKPIYLSLEMDGDHVRIEEFKNDLYKLNAFNDKLVQFSSESGLDLISLFARGCRKPDECELLEVASQLALISMLKDANVPIAGLCGSSVNSLVVAQFAGNLTTSQALKSAQNANQLTIKLQAPKDAYILSPTGLSALGELYMHGIPVKSSRLYKKVQYPLPSTTPTLSSLLKWNHSAVWNLKPYLVQDNFFQKSKNIRSFCDSRTIDDAFLFDHKIDGRILYPATGYLMLVWMAFAKFLSCAIWDYAVEFRNVTFRRATVLNKATETQFIVRVNEDNGQFTVIESETVVVTGRIVKRDDMSIEMPEEEDSRLADQEIVNLPAKAIYKEFRVRGYDYGQYFQGLGSAQYDGRKAQIIWRDILPKAVSEALTLETDEELANLWLRSWVPFVDAMFQLDILKAENDSRALFVPTRIDSIICSPELLRENIESSPKFTDGLTLSEAHLLDVYGRVDNLIFTKGLIVKGLKCTLLKRKQQAVRLQKYELVPYSENNTLPLKDRKLVEAYESACRRAARGQKVNSEQFKIDEPRFALLKSLVSGESCDLSTDLLAGQAEDDFYYPERLVLPVLNTVINNAPMIAEQITPIDIMEVTSTTWSLVSRIKDQLDLVLVDDAIKVSYNLLAARSNTMPQTILDQVSQVYEWTLDNYGAAPGSQDLIIYRASPVDPFDATSRLSAILKPGGFLWTIVRDEIQLTDDNNNMIEDQNSPIDEHMKMASEAGLVFVGQKRAAPQLPLSTLLFRRPFTEKVDRNNIKVLEIGINNYSEWFHTLKSYLQEENNSRDKRVYLVPKRTPDDVRTKVTPIVGFIKSLRLEQGGERLRSIVDLSTDKPIDIFDAKYAHILKADLVHNVYDSKKSAWGSYEHEYIDQEAEAELRASKSNNNNVNQKPVYLKVLKPGDMSTLTWTTSDINERAADLKRQKSNEHKVIDVHYSALNFRDIMFASGKLDSEAIPGIHADVAQDSILGLEYSGMINDGSKKTRVMGIAPYKGLASHVLASADDLDFVWPIPDSWNLDEAATVPVVYATAIYALTIRGRMTSGESVLIHSGCGGVGLAAINIAFAAKCRVFVTVGSQAKREYLLRKWPQLEGCIFNSRETSFEEELMKATHGRGVDLILNSLAEDKLQASLRCLAANGRFLEIGKVDFIQNHELFSHQLSENQSFHGVLLDALFRYSSDTYLPPRLMAEKRQLRALIEKGVADGTIVPLDRTTFDHDHVEDAFRYMMQGKHIGKVLVSMKGETNANTPITPTPATYCHPEKTYIVLGGSGGFGLELVQWLATKGARTIIIGSRRGLREEYQHYAINRLRSKGVKVIIDTNDITTENGCREMLMGANRIGPVGGVFNAAVVYRDALYDTQPIEQFVDVCGPKCIASLHMDKLTRELCPHLDYFVIWSSLSCARGNAGQTNYSFANSLMDSICERRQADGLPGVSIQWGVVGDAGIVADSSSSNDMILLGSQAQRMHSCLEVIDRSLQNNDPIVISYVKADAKTDSDQSNDKVDILNVITRLLGLKDISNIDPELTLGGLGVDSLIAVEIKQALDKTLGTQMSVKEVRDLTIARLMQLSQEQYSSAKPSSEPTGNQAGEKST